MVIVLFTGHLNALFWHSYCYFTYCDHMHVLCPLFIKTFSYGKQDRKKMTVMTMIYVCNVYLQSIHLYIRTTLHSYGRSKGKVYSLV
jgi:hypothetical protein